MPNQASIEGIAIAGDRLCFSGFDSKEIPKNMLRYVELASVIDLSHNKLNNIEELGKFTMLEELNLDNNDVNDDTEFPTMPRLTTLSLNKNKLVDCDNLVTKLRRNCPNLRYISLLGNDACPHPLLGYSEKEYQQARRLIASHIPTLETINFEEVTDDERWYPATSVEAFEELGTLPENVPGPRAAAGKVKYTYIGKQSEGNRFIKNNQL